MITFSLGAEQPSRVSATSPSIQAVLEPQPDGLQPSLSSQRSPQGPELQALQEVTRPKIGLII